LCHPGGWQGARNPLFLLIIRAGTVIAMDVVVRYANNFPGVRFPRAAFSPLFAALFFMAAGIRDMPVFAR
jgi:TRAP-type mannitol/chloroaromatic compound transport system permease small subunit